MEGRYDKSTTVSGSSLLQTQTQRKHTITAGTSPALITQANRSHIITDPLHAVEIAALLCNTHMSKIFIDFFFCSGFLVDQRTAQDRRGLPLDEKDEQESGRTAAKMRRR